MFQVLIKATGDQERQEIFKVLGPFFKIFFVLNLKAAENKTGWVGGGGVCELIG